MKHLALLASALVVFGCDLKTSHWSLLKDPNFNSWCGSSLCQWETDEGEIARVGTWEASDYGVELARTPTVISQDVDLSLGSSFFRSQGCLRIVVLGNLRAEAEVSLELDFFGDGSVEYEQAVPGSTWQRSEFLVKLPEESFDRLEVSLHKRGIGKAVFANVDVFSASGCRGKPIEIPPREAGTDCNEPTDCDSGLCTFVPSSGFRCAECNVDAHCARGQVCGLVTTPGSSGAFPGCIDAGSTPAGSPCSTPDQCADGFCTGALCGSCEASADCNDGELCGARLNDEGARYRACTAAGSLEPGEACVADAECASGDCGLVCLD